MSQLIFFTKLKNDAEKVSAVETTVVVFIFSLREMLLLNYVFVSIVLHKETYQTFRINEYVI